MKHCPLLEIYGVEVNERGYKIQWVIDICLDCPLRERCVFDSPGRIRKADREVLMEYYEEKVNEKLARWLAMQKDYPDFTQSLDDCFKWLVPKTSSIDLCGKNGYIADVHPLDMDGFYEASAETPAKALCLAMEQLIDAEKLHKQGEQEAEGGACPEKKD